MTAISAQDLDALLEIVRRAPMTRGETVFLTDLFRRLMQEVAEPELSEHQQEE